MSWNYRVVIRDAGRDAGLTYSLVEVYYDDDGEIIGWFSPGEASGETLEELRDDLTLMLEAVDRKPLTLTDLPS
jgi:hypothetical protein